VLLDEGVEKEKVNYRGWVPIQLASWRMKKFNEFRRVSKIREIEDCVDIDDYDKLECSWEKLLDYNSRFHYCIIAVADDADPKETTVYRQLTKIQRNYQKFGKFKFEVLAGFNNRDLENLKKANGVKEMTSAQYDKLLRKNIFIFKIKMDHNLLAYMAYHLKINIYDKIRKYHTNYLKTDLKYYEPFRDIQKQSLITYTLQTEFDLFRFHKEKLILAHFPIHHYKYRKYIDVYWKKYFWSTLFDPIKPKFDAKALRPLTQIAFYHGIQNGFYFGFLICYTSYMFPMALFGFACYLYGIFNPVEGERFDNWLIPIITVVTGIWATLFHEGWKRREKHLAYNFDMLGVQRNERQQFSFTGNYVIDKVTGTVVKYHHFSGFKRRMLVSFFLFILGRSICLYLCLDFCSLLGITICLIL
jgi:hypothetical protein